MDIQNWEAALVGCVLALVVALFARVVGLDRDRAFYPTVLVVIACLYDLFAVLGGSWPARPPQREAVAEAHDRARACLANRR